MQIYHKKTEAANAVNVSVRTIENWMKQGLISFIKKGGIVRIPEEELTRMLERYRVHGGKRSTTDTRQKH